MKKETTTILMICALCIGVAFSTNASAKAATQLGTPTNLKAWVTDGVVHLTWADTSGDQIAFWVARTRDPSKGDPGWQFIARVDKNSSSYNDSPTDAGVYYYRVQPVLLNGNAPKVLSSVVSVNVTETENNSSPSPFYVPNHVAVRENSTANKPNGPVVDLTWKDQSYSNSGYIIERIKNGGDWKVVGQTDADVEGWRDHDVQVGSSYAYRLRAVGTKKGVTLYSNYSDVKTVTVR